MKYKHLALFISWLVASVAFYFRIEPAIIIAALGIIQFLLSLDFTKPPPEPVPETSVTNIGYFPKHVSTYPESNT